METYLIYFLKASIGIILFYLLYQFVLRKETFYTSNRIYLIIGLILAVLLPIFPVTYISPAAMLNNSEFFTFDSQTLPIVLSSNSDINNEEGFWQLATIISSLYIIGASFFFLRLLLQTAFLLLKFSVGEKLQIEGVTVINQKHKIMPFSFFKVVFIHIKEYSKEELSNIIAHEKVHIQERHWVDLLIVELLTVVFWINPIVWLYEKSIKQNHEYLADQGVLLAGYNPGHYQALLINQLMGVKVMGFTNNLNFSLNKKRMEMMKKEKSPGFKKVKLLLLLPVIAGLMFAFAKPVVIVNSEDIDPNEDQLVSAKGEKIDHDNYFSQQEGSIVSIKGTVKSEDNVPLKYAIVMQENSSNGCVVDESGEFQMDVPEGANLEISYLGYKTVTSTVSHQKNTDHSYSFVMEKGVVNIKLPEFKSVEIKMQLPPPPPPMFGRYDKDLRTMSAKRLPFYKYGGIPIFARDIRYEVRRILNQTDNRGKVLVGFTIDLKGKVQNPHIIKSAGSNFLDDSAVEIITKLDDWSIGYQGCNKVSVDFSVPISFN